MKKRTKTKDQPPDQFLIQKFQEGLLKWGKQSEDSYRDQAPDKYNVFRISQIGECEAAVTRDWLSPRRERDPESLLRMYDGSITHEEVRKIFALSGLKLIHEERELRKSYKVKLEKVVEVPITLIGHQDGAFLYQGLEIVVDYKKASTFSFDKMQDELPDSYWDQMQGYLDCCDLPLGILFLKGVHGKVTALTVERDEEYFHKEVLPRLARIALLRKRSEIGRREYYYGMPPCTWCRHEKSCWGIEAALGPKKVILGADNPIAKEIRDAHRLHNEAKELEDRVVKIKSEAREKAIAIIRQIGQKSVQSVYGGITWTAFDRKTIRLKREHAQDALHQGFAEEVKSTVEYPLFTKGCTSDE